MHRSKHYVVWNLLKTLSQILERNVPTRVGYTYLIRTSHAIATVSMLPVVNGVPTDWENLYIAIKAEDELTEVIYPERKTIFSFDLQLYIKTIQLQEKPDIKE